MQNLVFSFPRMGNYHIVFKRAIQNLFPNADVLIPQPVTRRTLELGSRHSPDDVCAPFKHNLGSYIESLERGANVLLQTGSGCVYGYYGELQELILRELGYDFTFLCFSRGRTALDLAVKAYRKLGGTRSPKELAGTLVLSLSCLHVLDAFEYTMRENAGFETVPGAHDQLHADFLREFAAVKSLPSLMSVKSRYFKALREIPLDKPDGLPRVGIVGELYTLMEPSANFGLERVLAQSGIAVSRRMGVSYILSPHTRKSMRSARGYLSGVPGATGADSVAQAVEYAKRGYDGVLHLKSCGCTPEVNTTPALAQVSRDFNMPVLCMSFDTLTAETGVQTRLEAFADMIRMRRTHGI